MVNHLYRGIKIVQEEKVQLSFDFIEEKQDDEIKEKLLKINPLEMTPIEALNYLYELKKVALAKDGFLFVHFEKNGLRVNENLANIALISYPDLIKEEAVFPYLTEENIKKAVLRKPELVASIPNEFMTQNMYKFCNRVLRNYIILSDGYHDMYMFSIINNK